jgi:hypothetical protein
VKGKRGTLDKDGSVLLEHVLTAPAVEDGHVDLSTAGAPKETVTVSLVDVRGLIAALGRVGDRQEGRPQAVVALVKGLGVALLSADSEETKNS